MPQTQCVRCGAVFYTTPDGGDPCPACGLPPGAALPGAWAPRSTPLDAYSAPPDDYPDYFGADAPASWGAGRSGQSLDGWESTPPAPAGPGPHSRPLPPDTRSRPFTGGPTSGYGGYGPPSQRPGGYGPPSSPSGYRAGGQMDQWGMRIDPHDVVGMPPPPEYQFVTDDAPREPEPSEGSFRLAAVIGVALVVVIALGLVGIVYFGGPLNKTVTLAPTPSPTIGPTPTPSPPPLPSGFTLYMDRNGLFTMGIPSEWTDVTNLVQGSGTLPTGSGFVAYQDSGLGGILEIVYTPGSSGDLDAQETHFFSNVSAWIGANATVSNLSDPQTVSLANESWAQRAADVDLTDYGQTVHLIMLATSHHGHVYLIVYGGFQTTFSSLDTNFFQAALSTFTFRN